MRNRYRSIFIYYGRIAQVIEHTPYKGEVGGSSPSAATRCPGCGCETDTKSDDEVMADWGARICKECEYRIMAGLPISV